MTPRRRITALSVAAVLALGGAAAWWAVPAVRLRLAVAGVARADPDRRAVAWAMLLADAGDGRTRAAHHLPRILDALETAPDDALLDAADALGGPRLWGWASVPRPLRLRELRARAARVATGSAAGDAGIAIEGIASAPLDVAADDLAPVIGPLLLAAEPPRRIEAWRAACRWAGRARVPDLLALAVPGDDEALRRRRWLAAAFALDPAAALAAMGRAPTGGPAPGPAALDAALLALSRLDPSAAVDLAGDVPSDRRAAAAAALRYARDPEAADLLDRWARAGERTAGFALLARSPGRDDEASRRVALDPTQPPRRRRLAAWRWGRMPGDELLALLREDPVEPDGSVYAAVLLAERGLDRDAAAGLAERWMRDYDDDRKRAGALLAALLGARLELLARAYDLEDTATVRTTQRLALLAATAQRGGAGADDLAELAHRVGRHPSGDVRFDATLCRLIGGQADALAPLATLPPPAAPDYAAAVQARSWLVERFVPGWHAILGRSLGGDLDALRLHLEALEVLHDLTIRRLRYDGTARRFSIGGSAPSPAPSPAPAGAEASRSP